MTLREALGALHRAGRIRYTTLPGMVGEDDLGRRARRTGFAAPLPPWVGHGLLPVQQRDLDLLDPATIGCLAALAREASGDAGMHAAPLTPRRPDGQWVVWPDGAWGPDEWDGIGDTEGEAWAASLIAMAEALP